MGLLDVKSGHTSVTDPYPKLLVRRVGGVRLCGYVADPEAQRPCPNPTRGIEPNAKLCEEHLAPWSAFKNRQRQREYRKTQAKARVAAKAKRKAPTFRVNGRWLSLQDGLALEFNCQAALERADAATQTRAEGDLVDAVKQLTRLVEDLRKLLPEPGDGHVGKSA